MIDFRRGVAEAFALVLCYAVRVDSWVQTFRGNVSITSSVVKQSTNLDCLTLEYETDALSRYVGK